MSHSDISSKVSQTDLCFDTVTTFRGSIENAESSKSNCTVPFSDEDIVSQYVDESKLSMRQDCGREGFPLCHRVTLSGVCSFFHLESFANATEAEVMFLFHLHFSLHVAARKLARESPTGEYDRVYRAFLAAIAVS